MEQGEWWWWWWTSPCVAQFIADPCRGQPLFTYYIAACKYAPFATNPAQPLHYPMPDIGHRPIPNCVLGQISIAQYLATVGWELSTVGRAEAAAAAISDSARISVTPDSACPVSYSLADAAPPESERERKRERAADVIPPCCAANPSLARFFLSFCLFSTSGTGRVPPGPPHLATGGGGDWLNEPCRVGRLSLAATSDNSGVQYGSPRRSPGLSDWFRRGATFQPR
ncbi:hypothetical protein J6590_059377 [Homalodisca vitripennis]|nr:hypothetical protein J6590_059377 [Homalodisca vitripennis]